MKDKNYKDYIDSIIDTYMNYDYYIPYDFVESFVFGIKEVLTDDVQKLINSKQYYDAFNLCDYVLYKINRIDIEDDTDIHMLSQMCFDNWDRIISIADKDTNDKIFKRFIDDSSFALQFQ